MGSKETTMAGMTLPQYLLKQVKEHPRDVAIREKQKGIWQEWTWAQYLDEVRALTLGLVAIGLEKGDKLAIPTGLWSPYR
jgi:long-chain acyl-CoA synthetase